MRIISGFLRGRLIKTVPGKTTKPTADNVKEAIFNILGRTLSGGIALDLYAGSGNLGIEAISRGAGKCVFVEENRTAYNVIMENLKNLNILDRVETFKMTDIKALNYFDNKRYRFDYVFLDPPYYHQKIMDILDLFIDYDLLNPEATIVVECIKELNINKDFTELKFMKAYIYGIKKIIIYKRCGDRYE